MNYMGFIDPGIVFSIADISIMMILVTMLGGAATKWGPAVGAILFILVSEIFRVWVGSGHLLFFGVLIIAIIIYFPNGIVGTLVDRRTRKRRLRGAEAVA
jgi:branched-chain amino acid transport system permease protein